jgi:hypothetical protein
MTLQGYPESNCQMYEASPNTFIAGLLKMPKSKKPRKRYNPMRILNNKNLPGMTEMFRLFDPIYSVLEQMEFGEIETVSGKPVFLDYEGHWSEVSQAMIGWSDCWQRICDDQQIHFNPAPLRKMANKLDYGVPLEVDDIAAAREVIDLTKRVFMRTPAHILRSHAVTEQIAIEFEKRQMLKEAA